MNSTGDKRVKVALMTYAIDNRPAKGTAIVARKCVEELLRSQNEFDLTFIHYEKCDDPIYAHGVKEIIMPTFAWSFLNRRSLRQILFFLTSRESFDIIQWFQPRLYPFFWQAPATHIVVEVHGAGDVAKEAPFDIGRLLFNWTVKTFIRRIDRGIVASEFAKRDIIEKYGFLEEQVRVVHNGADPSFRPSTPERVAAVKEKYGLPNNFFLGVGRLNPNKNVFRTLQGFERFLALSPESDFFFVNIGAQGTDKSLIDAWLSESSARDRIQFVPYVDADDLPAVYGAAYALVFPLLNEGFGLPAIEAMACGTPTIVSNTAYPEIDTTEAMLVDALEVEDIANAMLQLMQNLDLRAQLVSNGFIKAQKLTWEEMGNGLRAIYRELTAGR